MSRSIGASLNIILGAKISRIINPFFLGHPIEWINLAKFTSYHKMLTIFLPGLIYHTKLSLILWGLLRRGVMNEKLKYNFKTKIKINFGIALLVIIKCKIIAHLPTPITNKKLSIFKLTFFLFTQIDILT